MFEGHGEDSSVMSAIAEVPWPLDICECIVPKGSRGHHDRNREADHYHGKLCKQEGAIPHALVRESVLFYVGLLQNT